MTQTAYTLAGREVAGKTGIAETIDRWIYVFMAALFVATALLGFVPDSIGQVRAIGAGQRPPFPPVLHVHAVLMGGWLLLLLAQTTLVATGHKAFHRKLGLASLALAPAIVVTGLILVPTDYHLMWNAMKTAPAAAQAGVKQIVVVLGNVMFFQIRAGISFALFVGLALLARRADPGLHKRLMIIATVVPLGAAVDRIDWLPSTLPGNPISIDLYALLWLSPMIVWDLFRTGRLHRAYWIWLAVTVPFAIAGQFAWGAPWWQALVPRLMGVT